MVDVFIQGFRLLWLNSDLLDLLRSDLSAGLETLLYSMSTCTGDVKSLWSPRGFEQGL
jgi:hypothetical protein